jgi:hypothetical protein
VGLRGRSEVEGVGSSADTGSAHPASRFGGVPVFPRAPGDQDRRPEPRLSSESLRFACVPADLRWRLPSRAPLQGGRRIAASDEHLAARDRSSPLLDFGPLQRFQRSGSGIGCSFTALPLIDRTHARRPAPPPSVLGVCGGVRSRGHLRRPRRLAPHRASRAASQRPGTLLRFRLQGLLPPRGSAPLSRPLLSCASAPPASPLSATHGARLQSLAPPRESVPRGTELPSRPLPS